MKKVDRAALPTGTIHRAVAELAPLPLVALGALLALFATTPGLAQTGTSTGTSTGASTGASTIAEQQFSEETTVTVVEIPVQVIDADGHPVRGLTADDFVIYDEGERRSPSFFEAVDFREMEEMAVGQGETATAQAPEDLPIAARRHFLLFFDLDFTTAQAIREAQQAAVHLVREGLEPTDLVGVTFFHGRSGSSAVIGFTSDRQQVLDALDELGRLVGSSKDKGSKDKGSKKARGAKDRSGRIAGDRLGLTFGGWDVEAGEIGRYVDKERSLAAEALDVAGVSSGRSGGTLEDMAAYAEQDVQQRRASRASTLVDALRATARQTRFIDGDKHLILFSEGFESSLYTDEGHSWLFKEIQDAIAELRRAGWTVHGIDSGEVWADWKRRQKRESLSLVAESTGGDVYALAADPGQALGKVLERTSVTYVLGFQTGEIPMDGSFRSVRVELVDRPDGPKGLKGAVLHHRAGYFTPRRPSARDGETWRAEAGELLLSGDETDEIGVAAIAAPVHVDAAGGRVPVLVEIDGAGLAVGTAAPRQIELFVYAFAPSGQVEAARSRQLLLDPSRLPSLVGGFKLLEDLQLPAGPHQVRVLVRNADTGQIALRVVPVTVPRPEDHEALLLPPVFVQEAGAPWLLVREEASSSYPFHFGGHEFVPSVGPVLKRDESRALLLMGFGLPRDGKGLRVRVVDAIGRPVQGAVFALSGRESGRDGAPDVVALNLAASGLEPGTYGVEATVEGGSGWVRGARFRVSDQ